MVERKRIDWMIIIPLKERKRVRAILGTWNLRKIS
jgi:hypothetical protein